MSADPSPVTLLGHLTDRRGAHEAFAIDMDGVPLLDALASRYQPLASVLTNTTASFTTADETKLDGIEAGADVTDATNVAAAGAVMKSLVDAKGDLIVATAADTVARVAVGATNGHVLTVDSAEAAGVKWAAAAGGGGSAQMPIYGDPGVWSYSSYVGFPTSTAWPIINRIYFTPFYFPDEVTIYRLGMFVTSPGAASNVVRMGLWEPAASNAPGTVLEEGTVTGDSGGTKSLVLGTPRTVSGLIWFGCGPQGSGSPGSTQLASGISTGAIIASTNNNGPTPNASILNSFLLFADSVSGPIGSNPTIALDGTAWSRFPFVAVRFN